MLTFLVLGGARRGRLGWGPWTWIAGHAHRAGLADLVRRRPGTVRRPRLVGRRTSGALWSVPRGRGLAQVWLALLLFMRSRAPRFREGAGRLRGHCSHDPARPGPRWMGPPRSPRAEGPWPTDRVCAGMVLPGGPSPRLGSAHLRVPVRRHGGLRTRVGQWRWRSRCWSDRTRCARDPAPHRTLRSGEPADIGLVVVLFSMITSRVLTAIPDLGRSHRGRLPVRSDDPDAAGDHHADAGGSARADPLPDALQLADVR